MSESACAGGADGAVGAPDRGSSPDGSRNAGACISMRSWAGGTGQPGTRHRCPGAAGHGCTRPRTRPPPPAPARTTSPHASRRASIHPARPSPPTASSPTSMAVPSRPLSAPSPYYAIVAWWAGPGRRRIRRRITERSAAPYLESPIQLTQYLGASLALPGSNPFNNAPLLEPRVIQHKTQHYAE